MLPIANGIQVSSISSPSKSCPYLTPCTHCKPCSRGIAPSLWSTYTCHTCDLVTMIKSSLFTKPGRKSRFQVSYRFYLQYWCPTPSSSCVDMLELLVCSCYLLCHENSSLWRFLHTGKQQESGRWTDMVILWNPTCTTKQHEYSQSLGETTQFTTEIWTHICSCHNFSPPPPPPPFLLCRYFWYQLVAYCVCFKMICEISL